MNRWTMISYGVLGCLLVGGFGVGCNTAGDADASRTVEVELPGDPAAAQRWFAQGKQAIQDQDFELAEDCFERALEADAGHGPAHNNLGKIQYLDGRLQDAALSFRAAQQSMPYRPEPLNNLGLVFETGNRLDDAAERFEAALKLAPNSFEYLGNLARVRVRRGDNDDTLRQQLAQIAAADPRERWKTWANQQLGLLEQP